MESFVYEDKKTYFVMNITRDIETGLYEYYDSMEDLVNSIGISIKSGYKACRTKKPVIGNYGHRYIISDDETDMWFVEELL